MSISDALSQLASKATAHASAHSAGLRSQGEGLAARPRDGRRRPAHGRAGGGRRRRPDRLPARPGLPAEHRVVGPVRPAAALRRPAQLPPGARRPDGDRTRSATRSSTWRWPSRSSCVLGILVAVTLRRLFPGRGIVLAILVLPWALPSVVSGVLWRRVFDPDNGLLNSVLLKLHVIHEPHVWLAGGRWAIAFITLVHVWGVLPLVSLILLAGLQSIPEELYNASSVDGAGAWRQFRHITLPLLRPSLAVAADDRHAARDRDLRRGLRAQRHGAEHALGADPGLQHDVRRGRLRPRHGARVPARRRHGAARQRLRARRCGGRRDEARDARRARRQGDRDRVDPGLVARPDRDRLRHEHLEPDRRARRARALGAAQPLARRLPPAARGHELAACGRHRDRGRRLRAGDDGERRGRADGDGGHADRRDDGRLRVRPAALPARAHALPRRARDDARAGLRRRRDALPGHGRRRT